MSRFTVFCIMPFREEFDDVYMVIKDACRDQSLGGSVTCVRADEIAKPGRITDQIIEQLRLADAVIADLTGNNPNVMYELGFAHALEKNAIILNQSVTESPFDVKTFRQIAYDRNRLVKDCRPRLIQALAEVAATVSMTAPENKAPNANTSEAAKPSAESNIRAPVPVNSDLVNRMQGSHLRLRLANKSGDTAAMRTLAEEVIALVDRVSVFAGSNKEDVTNFSRVAGNCAVEMEKAQLFRLAEDMFKRTLGLVPGYAGTHIQYADFLLDQGRTDEAILEVERASELEPDEDRLRLIRTKMAMMHGPGAKEGKEIEEKLRRDFEAKPDGVTPAASYLAFLMATKAPIQQVEELCQKWEAALPIRQKPIARRALADSLASARDYVRGIAMYNELVTEETGTKKAELLHNLATCLTMVERPDEAITRWVEAYSLMPTSAAIRAAFSQVLSIKGRLEDALAVNEGRPLPRRAEGDAGMGDAGDAEAS
jgi:tetratricopeptide (TPR) repeat protein